MFLYILNGSVMMMISGNLQIMVLILLCDMKAVGGYTTHTRALDSIIFVLSLNRLLLLLAYCPLYLYKN
jgi:hypothetical protein